MAELAGTLGRATLVLAGVLACFAAPASGQPAVAGSIKSVAGTAFIVRAGQEMPAAVGQSVGEADVIRTAADGRLGVTLKDGTRLSLGGNTELRLDTFEYSPAEGRMAIAVKVLRGVAAYISGRIADLAPGSVKIETPTSVIGIRGTHLLIGVDQP